MDITKPVSEFIDAQEMAKTNPDTFEAPEVGEIAGVKVGDHVKLCPSHERFWVEVEQIVEGEGLDRLFVGRVDNDLVCSEDHGLSFNDRVQFRGRHIYSIYG